MQEEIFSKLNNAQVLPVKDTEGAVLVIAGAGSGKTRVLTSRVAYLVKEKNIAPRNILAITFTNKAANEMKKRLSEMVGNIDEMWVSTIHSMCTRILRSNISYLGYDKNFTIYTDVERERVLKRLISGDTTDEKLLKNLKFHIGNAKSMGLKPSEYRDYNVTLRDADKICGFYKQYEDELKRANALDFDDLLIKTNELFLSFEEIRDYYARKFEYIHIDEFQDINSIQYEIVKQLYSYHHNIFAVGDDDQSIYGWRGAEIKNILNFEKDFSNSKVYKLEQNYRSTKRILNLANKIIVNNTERKKKELWTENDEGTKTECYMAQDETGEASWTAMQIKAMISRGAKASDFAVLMRMNALSRAYEQEFLKYNIHYKVFGGFKFYERKEIKDILAYFRLLNNPLDNDAIMRVINVPPRGIGDKTVESLVSYSDGMGLSLYDALIDIDKIDVSGGIKTKLVKFKNLIVSLIIDKETMPLKFLLKNLIDKTNYMSLFIADTEENMNKRANVSELENSIIEFCDLNENATLSDFLNSVTLSSDIDEMETSDYVTIATVHAVKGLEFNSVFVCGLEESIFPVSRATGTNDEMEEERRLMYVAITRARERLFFTYAGSRYLFGDRKYLMRSRFLNELADELGIKKPQPRSRVGEDEISSGYSASQGYSGSYAQKLFSQPKPKTSEKDYGGYVIGRRVKHVKFGEGIIIKSRGSNKDLIVDVAFKGVGVKSLSVQFAPMELI